MVPSSTTVHNGTRLAGRCVAEGRGVFAVEVALEAVADRFMQQMPGQPGPSTTAMVAGGCIDRAEVSERWRAASPA